MKGYKKLFVYSAMLMLSVYGCGGGGGGGGGGGSSSGPSAEVLVSPAPGTVTKGQEFTRTVDVQNAGNTYYAAFDVTYDPKVIEFLDADEGSFFNQNQAGSTWFEAALQNGSQGRVALGITRLGAVGEVSGSGNLVTLHFKAVGIGTSAISLSDPKGFKNSSGQGVAVGTWADGMVTVQ
jgi:general secretion pathway protein D